MKNKFFLCTLLGASLFYASSAVATNQIVSEDFGEYGRLTRKIVIPEFHNAHEIVDFVSDFAQREQGFWQEFQQEYRQDHKRLDVILRIVDRAVAALPKSASRIDKINAKYLTLLKLISSPTAKREDKDHYDIYKSYGEAGEFLAELNGELQTLKSQKNLSIDMVRTYLSSFISKKEANYQFQNMLYTTSSVEQIHELLQQEVNYYVCNIKILFNAYKEMLFDILAIYKNPPTVVESKKNDIQPHKKHRKIKKKKPKLPLSSVDVGVRDAEASTTSPAIKDASLVLAESIPMVQQEPESLIAIQKAEDVLSAPKSEDVQAEETPLPPAKAGVMGVKGQLITQDVEGIDFDEEKEATKPWEKYPKEKSKLLSKEKSADIRELAVPKLSSESANTLLAFFGREKAYIDINVPMKDFVDIILNYFKGSLTRVGETLHFKAQHPKTHEWYSVCMHVLHRDRNKFIPRNTFYWKKARQLLENLNAEELLEDSLF